MSRLDRRAGIVLCRRHASLRSVGREHVLRRTIGGRVYLNRAILRSRETGTTGRGLGREGELGDGTGCRDGLAHACQLIGKELLDLEVLYRSIWTTRDRS